MGADSARSIEAQEKRRDEAADFKIHFLGQSIWVLRSLEATMAPERVRCQEKQSANWSCLTWHVQQPSRMRQIAVLLNL